MVKFKILKEVTPVPSAEKEPINTPPVEKKVDPAPDQAQLTQAIGAVEQVINPVVAQSIGDYLQKNLPTLIQNALKGQKQPPKKTTKQPAPATEQDKIAAQGVAKGPPAVQSDPSKA